MKNKPLIKDDFSTWIQGQAAKIKDKLGRRARQDDTEKAREPGVQKPSPEEGETGVSRSVVREYNPKFDEMVASFSEWLGASPKEVASTVSTNKGFKDIVFFFSFEGSHKDLYLKLIKIFPKELESTFRVMLWVKDEEDKTFKAVAYSKDIPLNQAGFGLVKSEITHILDRAQKDLDIGEVGSGDIPKGKTDIKTFNEKVSSWLKTTYGWEEEKNKEGIGSFVIPGTTYYVLTKVYSAGNTVIAYAGGYEGDPKYGKKIMDDSSKYPLVGESIPQLMSWIKDKTAQISEEGEKKRTGRRELVRQVKQKQGASQGTEAV
jgi:hypothetical protein